MNPETQPRGVGKAHEPSSNKLPAECSSLLTVIKAPEAPEVCLQAHLTNAAVTSAVCLWQVLVSASRPTAMRRSHFYSRAAAKLSTSINRKDSLGFLWIFLTHPHFDFIEDARSLTRD